MTLIRLVMTVVLSEIMYSHAADDVKRWQLFNAVKYGASLAEMEKIIMAGADVNYSEFGKTSCHFAAAYNQGRVIEMLFRNNADINIKDVDGYTPLHEACSSGASYAVKMLLQCDANAQEKNNRGETPVEVARACGRCAIVELLEDYENNLETKEPGVN